jgi:hypothetical protein
MEPGGDGTVRNASRSDAGSWIVLGATELDAI